MTKEFLPEIRAASGRHTHDWDAVDGWQRSRLDNHMSHEHGGSAKASLALTEAKNLHENMHDAAGTGRPGEIRFESELDAMRYRDEQAKGKALMGWADAAQYRSEPMPQGDRMTVTLLMATPDPLGVVAALCGMYEGRVARSLSEVTDEQRRQAFEDMLATELNGPLSAVQFLFLVEGVDRAFTHQAVRQQLAFFAQESLRFAVKEDWAHEVPLPPSLAGMADDHPWVRIWRKALNANEDAYGALVADGMPAEEARGLLPHAVTTRYYWSVNLKGLLIEAGKRTCTQAQFHWRQMFSLVAKALREYSSKTQASVRGKSPSVTQVFGDDWQFQLIADQLRPHCYQSGSCGFMAKFDRGCTIRERVEQNAKAGRPSSEWHLPGALTARGEPVRIPILPINPREWAADPGAART